MADGDAAISTCLAEWIETCMPEIGGLQGTRIRCCERLPFQWVPGFMPTVRGITLWNTIYLKPRCCPIDPFDSGLVELLLHELVHVAQFRRSPMMFPIRYLFDLVRVGYWNIPAEQQARTRARQLLEEYERDAPCRQRSFS